MATSYPLPTLAAVVSTSGITAPSYADILLSLEASFRSIHGEDAYLSPDSADGQFLAIVARAIADCNDALVACYNHMSPLTATGEGLSSVVSINGIARALASNSQVSLVLTGTVGTFIQNGQARDTAGNLWNLPAAVVIGAGGTVTVTATADQEGDIQAGAGAVSIIATPTAGWATVTNAAPATPGEPVETDAALRTRQAASVALGSVGLLEGLVGALQALDGVTHARVYENNTGSTDANGIPARSLAPVVAGGDATEVATTIMRKRAPGAGLYGSTTVSLLDSVGQTQAIKFTVPTIVDVTVAINLTGLPGYTTDVGEAIKAALVAHSATLRPGENVYWSRLFKPAGLFDNPTLSATYEINTLQIKRGVDALAQADVVIGVFELARITAANITITAV